MAGAALLLVLLSALGACQRNEEGAGSTAPGGPAPGAGVSADGAASAGGAASTGGAAVDGSGAPAAVPADGGASSPPAPGSASPAAAAAHLSQVVAEHADQPIYRCEVGGALEALELDTRLDALCRRAPEMGPCQYERSRCRARGGVVRVFDGSAVTAEVEAVYDQRVIRVRFGEAGTRSR